MQEIIHLKSFNNKKSGALASLIRPCFPSTWKWFRHACVPNFR